MPSSSIFPLSFTCTAGASHLTVLPSRILCAIVVVLTTCTTAYAQTNFNAVPFAPPAFPLMVRSPYLNSWLRQGFEYSLPNFETIWSDTTPNFVNLYIAMQIDGQNYYLLGQDEPANTLPANLTASLITPTRTVFSYLAGPLNVNISFLNPFESNDLVRQSMPFSYFYVDIASANGSTHNISLYADITGEWAAGDENSIIDWSAFNNGSIMYHSYAMHTPQAFSELNDHPLDATAYLATPARDGLTFKVDNFNVSRTLYATMNQLDDHIDQNFRAIIDNIPTFATAVDLGTVSSTNSPVIWALGVVRDPAVQYITANNVFQKRRSFFWSQFPTAQAVIEFFLGDFNNALASASKLDQKIQTAARAYSEEYSDLLSLAFAQAMGASDITLSMNDDGSFNTSDVLVFVKNLGSVGGQGVNRVDALFAIMPVYLYADPALLGYILESLLRAQEPAAGLYQAPFAALDLGTNYPNATKPTAFLNEAIETSADMIIMTLAHAQTSGNGTLIAAHYNLLKSWGDYLVQNTLAPGLQATSDQLGTSNQTNLALKGIVGIGAMAKISQIVGEKDDNQFFQSNSQSFISQWSSLALGQQKILGSYDNQSSSGLMYNLYADTLLQLDLVPSTVYQTHASFLTQQLAVPNQHGLTVDSAAPGITRTDWMFFTAATLSDSATRNLMIQQVHDYATAKVGVSPMSVSYLTFNGTPVGGVGSPLQGGMFSLLAVNQSIQDISLPNGATFSGSQAPGKGHIANTGVIAGAVVGTIAIVSAAIFAVAYYWRRRPQQRKQGGMSEHSLLPFTSAASTQDLSASASDFINSVHPDQSASASRQPLADPSAARSMVQNGGPVVMDWSSKPPLDPHNEDVPSMPIERRDSLIVNARSTSEQSSRQGNGLEASNVGIVSELANIRQEMERLRILEEQRELQDRERLNADLAYIAPPEYTLDGV